MKVSVLYTRNTPADRDIAYLKRKLDEVRVDLHEVDADSREGTALIELYDAVERPTVLLTGDDGRLINKWQGNLPTVEAIMAYRGSA